ncbi:hypothetical protein A3C89_01930 [Candidatus Kaiserbacteria bacterium RIFCSPHIGHO2_02_FULL_50_50]|uniref:DUF4190 domain-containing protein n=1 Tax=Candidatus Kaiserbacteria bacterium RIFCSPHIGHO2_02_FULL_50_50 TaxID=1798492 RepID=A0A1F6DCK2_9BACT|nr:MAG: hypothetical protein A3C89_01930 [Candidatus Kaiserbacteria bacterium RIFCSPHIGHO2_02_FULL_50_50]OGG89030.1 MAG: hypothetical protein A3G62_04330 [Candidatus Kaiserbacteria bacterium RIFCSPLOWO2_12_FULL_50_10]
MEREVEQVKGSGIKKDIIAIISFILGLLSVPFYFIGVIPLAAIAFGLFGISRTKVVGSGRWMVVTGLVLGCIYLVNNLYMNGHFDTSNTNNSTSVYSETTELHAEIVKLEHVDKSESTSASYEIQAELTNISERPIRAFKGRLTIKDIFDEHLTIIDVVQTSALLPGDKTSALQSVIDTYGYDRYDRLHDAGKIENLKVEFQASEIIYDN